MKVFFQFDESTQTNFGWDQSSFVSNFGPNQRAFKAQAKRGKRAQ